MIGKVPTCNQTTSPNISDRLGSIAPPHWSFADSVARVFGVRDKTAAMTVRTLVYTCTLIGFFESPQQAEALWVLQITLAWQLAPLAIEPEYPPLLAKRA